MFIQKIIFNSKRAPISFSDDELYEAITDLLSGLRRNGQIVQESEGPLISKGDKMFYVSVLTFEKGSLSDDYDNIYVKEDKAKLWKYFGISIQVKLEEESKFLPDAEVPVGAITDDWFILQWGGYSPVRSGKDAAQIPLYKLPFTYIDGQSHNDINFWENDFEAIYRIWFRSAVNEKFFYRQLTNVDSDLNQQGRKICSNLESKLGKPVYCFIHTNRKSKNHCPSCGSEWQDVEIEGESDVCRKCDECRLVTDSKILNP